MRHSLILHSIALSCLLLVNVTLRAQQYVSNGGFETTTGLPIAGNQLNLCQGWNNVNGTYYPSFSVGSPDLYSLNGSGGVHLPNAGYATLQPHTGNNCIGLTLTNALYNDFREYASCTLLNGGLTPGTTYKVSFYACAGTNRTFSSCGNNLGISFSTSPLSQSGWNPILQTPSINVSTIINSETWTYYEFFFTATANYTVLTMGNFLNDAGTTLVNSGGGPTSISYVFVDDLSIEPSCTISFDIDAPSEVCANTAVELSVTNVVATTAVTYNWLSNGASIGAGETISHTFATSGAQQITVQAVGTAGVCPTENSLTLSVLATAVFNVPSTILTCHNTADSLPYWPQLQWTTTNGANATAPFSEGNYVATYSDECSTQTFNTSVQTTQLQSPFTTDSLLLCESDHYVLVSPTQGLTTQVNQMTISNPFVPKSTGLYVVRFSNTEGCELTDSVFVTLIGNPAWFLPDKMCSSEFQSMLDDFNDPNWSINIQETWTESDLPKTVNIALTSTCDTLLLATTVEPETVCQCAVFVPNTFTPNQDNLNEVWQPVFSITPFYYKLILFDRWGAEIFRTGSNTGDATPYYLGNIFNDAYYVQNEIYNWTLEYSCDQTSEIVTKRGFLLVLR